MIELSQSGPTDRMGLLLAAHQYELGSCFRLHKGTQVTRIGETTSYDGETPLYACRECVQELLTMHERAPWGG